MHPVIALSFLLALATTSAHAGVSTYVTATEVEVECTTSVSGSNTDNDLVGLMWMDNYLHTIESAEPGWCLDGADFENPWNKDMRISDFAVEATGSDAFLLDRVVHYTYTPVNSNTYVDSLWYSGMCLSEDSTDEFTGIDEDGCDEALQFDMYAGTWSPASKLDHAWTVRIQTSHDDITGENSNDKIKVYFKDGSTTKNAQWLTYAGEGEYGATFTGCSDTACDIDRIELDTDGTNALFVDFIQLKYYEEGYSEYWTVDQWGGGEGKGWCLSEDETDADGSWSSYVSGSKGTKCGYKLRFDVGVSGGWRWWN